MRRRSLLSLLLKDSNQIVANGTVSTEIEGRLLLFVFQIDVGAVRDEQVGDRGEGLSLGCDRAEWRQSQRRAGLKSQALEFGDGQVLHALVERGVAVVVLRVDETLGLEQKAHRLRVQRLDGEVERRLQLRVRGVDGGSSRLNEQLSNIDVAVEGCEVERGVAVVLRLVDQPELSARSQVPQKRAHCGRVPSERSVVQRVEAQAAAEGDVRLVGEQETEEIVALPAHRVVQRRLATGTSHRQITHYSSTSISFLFPFPISYW